MAPMVVGVLSSFGCMLTTAMVYTLVRPARALSLFRRGHDDGLSDDAAAVRYAQVVLGIAVFAFAFGLGAATAFLSATR